VRLEPAGSFAARLEATIEATVRADGRRQLGDLAGNWGRDHEASLNSLAASAAKTAPLSATEEIAGSGRGKWLESGR
jgi:hypothetical protein